MNNNEKWNKQKSTENNNELRNHEQQRIMKSEQKIKMNYETMKKG